MIGRFRDVALVWPAHFPAECPPKDAVDLSHDLFYLVGTNPATAEDFHCALQKGTFIGRPPCLRSSLSCGLTLDYITRLKTIPTLRNKLIAMASLVSDDGKIRQTGKPGHHSMWLVQSSLANAPSTFEVIE